jgi:hypothetical protein
MASKPMIMGSPISYLAFSRYTSLGTAQTLTPPSAADGVLMQAVTQNVVFSIGSTATATNGFILLAGAEPTLVTFPSGTPLSVIQQAAGAELRIQWIKL